MPFTVAVVALALLVVVTPGGLAAPLAPQTIPGDVTFEVPLNLTRLAPDITKVSVTCTITSVAITAGDTDPKGRSISQLSGALEVPVSSGQLVTTARVVVPVTAARFTSTTGMYNDPTGKTANYHCDLLGFSSGSPSGKPAGGWNQFTDNNPNVSFRLTRLPRRLRAHSPGNHGAP